MTLQHDPVVLTSIVCLSSPPSQPLQVHFSHVHTSDVQQLQFASQLPQPHEDFRTSACLPSSELHPSQLHLLQEHLSVVQQSQLSSQLPQAQLAESAAQRPDWQHLAFLSSLTLIKATWLLVTSLKTSAPATFAVTNFDSEAQPGHEHPLQLHSSEPQQLQPLSQLPQPQNSAFATGQSL
ncbi:MAG: hypothetical protein AAF664_01480 [Planctomycetota bacterium]